MFLAGSALSKLVNYFYIHPCTSKPAVAQEVHDHEACMHSSKDLWSGMHGCIGPFFLETKSRRFENTVEATRVTVRIPQLWAVRFIRPAARIDTTSEIQN
jgi:hypothetical protein